MPVADQFSMASKEVRPMTYHCPVCHTGYLEEITTVDQGLVIQCSEYPACRFSAESWERVSETVARFHHPVTPGQ